MILINKTSDAFRFEYEILYPQYTFNSRDEVALVGLIRLRNTSYPTIRMNDLDYNLVLASIGGIVGILVNQTVSVVGNLCFSTTLVQRNNEFIDIDASDYIRPTRYIYEAPTDYHYFYGQKFIWNCDTRVWNDQPCIIDTVHNIMLKDAINDDDRVF